MNNEQSAAIPFGEHVPWTGDDPATWADVPWPDWVPAEVRAEIAEFWSVEYGRSPREYREQHRTNYARAPAFGVRVRVLAAPRHGRPVGAVGRYVHCWNNIGRVVRDDGSVLSAVATFDCAAAEAAREAGRR